MKNTARHPWTVHSAMLTLRRMRRSDRGLRCEVTAASPKGGIVRTERRKARGAAPTPVSDSGSKSSTLGSSLESLEGRPGHGAGDQGDILRVHGSVGWADAAEPK